MRTLLPVLLALAASGASLSAQVRPGTYSLRICEAEPCRATDAVASGVLVLLPDTLRDAQIPDSVRWTFYDGYLRLEDEGRGHRNGCLAMHDSRMSPQYARYARETYWHRDPEEPARLHFLLSRSPDSRNSVSAVATRSGFRGRECYSSVYREGEGDPPDVVVGEYRGPPDPAPCFAGVVRPF